MPDVWLGSVLSLGLFLAPVLAFADCVTADHVPNRVIALFDGRTEPEAEKTRLAQYMASPLAKHGFIPLYVDVARPLPSMLDVRGVAGVASWFTTTVPDADDLADWLDARDDGCGPSLPRLVIGDPGGPALWRQLGVQDARMAVLHDGDRSRLQTEPGWFGNEAPLEVPPGRHLAPRLPEGALPLATLLGQDGKRRVLGFHTPARLWLSDLAVLAEDGRGENLWVADPDNLITVFQGKALRPVPDLAMFQGRRIALTVVLTQGWMQRAPATGPASLGPRAHDLALAVFGAAGEGTTFGWPDTEITASAGAPALAAGQTLSNAPHVTALPVTGGKTETILGGSVRLRLSRSNAGGPDAAPHIDPPMVNALYGTPGFADPTGLHARAASVNRSNTPWPTAPDTLMVRAHDLLNASVRETIITALHNDRENDRAHLDAARYAAWLRGAADVRFKPDGPQTWHVQNRGALNTVRFDAAEDWILDLPHSKGVLGASQIASALFVALDPAERTPVIALKPGKATALHAAPPMAEVVEAGPFLADLHRDGCKTTVMATGAGRVTLRAAKKPKVRADGTPLGVTSVADGMWRILVPESTTPTMLSISVGCD